MEVKKLETGEWHADIRPNGAKGKRYRKTFATKGEALRWIAWIKTNKTQKPDWEPQPKDKRRLSELIRKWHEVHGQHLKDGKNRLLTLNMLCKGMKDPIAVEITADSFLAYRNERLKAGIGENTTNHEQAYLSAVFNELTRIGDWKEPNPIAKVKKLKLDEQELHFLSHAEIQELLERLRGKKSDAYHVARICLATGARWREAESLTGEQIRNNTIRYRATKNGKNRSVPITQEFHISLPVKTGRLFTPAYNTFTRTVDECSFELPKGQLTHVLRHTFASHFIQNGGNILVLQKILGHSSLIMTMRYAHLAPEHLEEATVYNPLAKIN